MRTLFHVLAKICGILLLAFVVAAASGALFTATASDWQSDFTIEN